MMSEPSHSPSVVIPETPRWLTSILAAMVLLLALPFLIVPGLAWALPGQRPPIGPMIGSVVTGLFATGIAWILWRGERAEQDWSRAAPALRRGLAIFLVLLAVPFLLVCLAGLASPEDRTASRLPLVFISGFIAVSVFSLAYSIWHNQGVPLWMRRVIVMGILSALLFASASVLLVFARGGQLDCLVLLAVLGVAWFLRPAATALWLPTPTPPQTPTVAQSSQRNDVS